MSPADARPNPTLRVFQNLGWLLGGRGFSALLTLGATAIMARTLGPEGLGAVVLLHTGVLVIKQLCNAKTSHAVIRFGVPLLPAAGSASDEPAPMNTQDRRSIDNAAWSALVAGLFRLDMLSALLATALGLLCLLAMTQLVGPETSGGLALLIGAAWLYLPALATSATEAARGALRATDRYRLSTLPWVIGAGLRLIGCALAALLDAPLGVFVAVWALAQASEHLCQIACAAPHLKLTTGGASLRQALAENAGLGAYLKVVYWQSNLDMLPRHGATLAVGGLFGADGAGVFRLARDLAEIAAKPVTFLRQAVFPDLSRTWADSLHAFRALIARTSIILGATGALLTAAAWGFGSELLALAGGEAFRTGEGLLVLLLAAASLELAGAALRPASHVLDLAGPVFRLQAVSVLAYFVCLAGFSPLVGLTSPGWAGLISASISLSAMIVLVTRHATPAAWQSRRLSALQ